VATHLAKVVRDALDRGVETLEVTAEAEADWVRFHEEMSGPLQETWRECTPSYFNQEGKADQRIMRNGAFGGSPSEFRDILTKWRDDGMPGLTITTKGNG
jgi:cyclohexanone monooxygenase